MSVPAKVFLLSVGLAALAGYVDAVGFIALGGYFVSFMTGNSTHLAVQIGHGDFAGILPPLYLVAGFVGGGAAGTLLGHAAGRHRRSAILFAVAFVLALAAALEGRHLVLPGGVAMAFAMGAENDAVRAAGDVRISLTYMTGTLVTFGQKLAEAILARRALGWLPYLVLWVALVAGAVGGAALDLRIGVGALWIAVAAAFALATASACLIPAGDSAR